MTQPPFCMNWMKPWRALMGRDDTDPGDSVPILAAA
jgi:hypothetical protein